MGRGRDKTPLKQQSSGEPEACDESRTSRGGAALRMSGPLAPPLGTDEKLEALGQTRASLNLVLITGQLRWCSSLAVTSRCPGNPTIPVNSCSIPSSDYWERSRLVFAGSSV